MTKINGVITMRSLNLRKKTTTEIKVLIEKANMKFDFIVNEALNNYLQKIFISCPFTGEICTKSQCMECETSRSNYSQTHI
jgi:hypothetical protein